MSLDILYTSTYKYLEKNYADLSEYRNFYGFCFSAYLFQDDTDRFQFCIDGYNNLDKGDRSFHHEFNNYILLQLQGIPGVPKIDSKNITFNNNDVTNWFLLKQLCLLRVDKNHISILKDIKSRLESYQDDSGLIWDDKDNKSFQYHCFCIALLEEIFDITQDKDIYNSFMSGVDFICNFILPNGRTLYIGRGQEQIFGYGVLIYALGQAYQYSKNERYLYFQNKVVDLCGKYINLDGTIPLVLNDQSTTTKPKLVDVNDEVYIGWYKYNNYYDYLPFFMYYIKKALVTHKKHTHISFIPRYEYSSGEFSITQDKKYIYILSRPCGSMSNDLPLPLIYDKKGDDIILGPYGGEEFGSKFYSQDSISLPYFDISAWSSLKFFGWKDTIYFLAGKLLNKSTYKHFFFRKILNYTIDQNNLKGEGNICTHQRYITYNQDGSIGVKDNITFHKDIQFNAIYLVNACTPDISNISIQTKEKNNILSDHTYNVFGKQHKNFICFTDASYNKGDVLTFQYDIILSSYEKS